VLKAVGNQKPPLDRWGKQEQTSLKKSITRVETKLLSSEENPYLSWIKEQLTPTPSRKPISPIYPTQKDLGFELELGNKGHVFFGFGACMGSFFELGLFLNLFPHP